VREGEVIARLESFDYEAAVVRARAAVQRPRPTRRVRPAGEAGRGPRRPEDRRRRPARRGGEPRQDRRGRARQAKADLAFVDAQLQNTVIRAPFGGVVVKKMAEVGESVAPIPPGVNLSTSSARSWPRRPRHPRGGGGRGRVERGQGGERPAGGGHGRGHPGPPLQGVLRQVIPTADRTKATVMVKVTILDKDKDLKPEMSAKVTFLEPEKKEAAPAAARPWCSSRRRRSSPATASRPSSWSARTRPSPAGRPRHRAAGQVIVKDGLAGGEIVVARRRTTCATGRRSG